MRRTVLLLALLCCVAAPAWAQRSPILSTIEGVVLDELGAPMPGVVVDILPEGMSRPVVSTVTDVHGSFTVAAVPGTYLVAVRAPGFDPVRERTTVLDAETSRVQLVMHVASVRQEVSVVGSAGYGAGATSSATRTPTGLQDVPQAVTVVTRELIQDQLMTSLSDVVRYVPGVSSHQGENNRDQVVIRGNNSSADFFVDGVRDDVQYYRDLYNLERVEALKGPNAMIFGRGGGGGVINRVTKQPMFARAREISARFGSFGHSRFTSDINEPLGSRAAFRLNAMYESSDSFRDGVDLERYGVNPAFTFRASDRLSVVVSAERLHDRRTADRGVPSFAGLPATPAPGTYFGDPQASFVRADVDLLSVGVERRVARWTIRNRTLTAYYDRGYQNFVPGAVTADRSSVTLTAYNNTTKRLNVFNQTDVTRDITTGAIRHSLLAGAELGRQATDNFRNTGYFNNAATSALVPFDRPTVTLPVTFRQSATDANNHVATAVAALYGQDQIVLSRHVQLLAGLRFDLFTIRFQNNRAGGTLTRTDGLVSPRAALVVKPAAPVSLYGAYSVSHLPSAGDQFSSLTSVTEQMKPEQFLNYEAGAKWQATRTLFVTTAAYRLDRVNTRSTDPNDPTRIVQTGSQRSTGWEMGINGYITPRWQIAGGYSHQRARVTSATTSAAAGAEVAQVPRHTLALWNLYQLHAALGAGIGIVHRADMFAAVDNRVILPRYTDVDAAVYWSIAPRLRLQVNVENMLDRRYYVHADGNNNISPGSPRAVRASMTIRF